jgi:apolipoprotein N-acyltransferase
VLLSLSFPKFGHAAVAWVALVPLLVALAGRHGPAGVQPPAAARSFRLGLATGIVYFGGTLYWLVDTMATYGGLSMPVALGVAALLVAYLALFPAAFALATGVVVRALGTPALLLAPALWVSTELGRTYIWDGFPWALLGASQAPLLPIAQAASVVGVYGVSFLVVLGGVAIAWAIVGRGFGRAIAPAGILVLLIFVALWGRVRLEANVLVRQGTPVTVGVVQGNFAQDVKWDPSLETTIVARYERLTVDAAARGASFVVWPESALPFYFLNSPVRARPIRDLARTDRLTLLVGGDELETAPAAAAGAPVRLYNSAFLIGPSGDVQAVYRKIHLVPFGEYVPLQSLLFFAAPLVQAVSNFSPGTVPVLLPVEGHPVSTAICYEVVYPGLIRRFVREGSELLTTITNDAWFGRSSAPAQHFEQAAMRAIEEGRYLVRAANTGISGIVDPYGRVLDRSRLFETTVLVREVRFLTGRTVYSRTGDWLGLVSLALSAGALAAVWRVRARSRRS